MQAEKTNVRERYFEHQSEIVISRHMRTNPARPGAQEEAFPNEGKLAAHCLRFQGDKLESEVGGRNTTLHQLVPASAHWLQAAQACNASASSLHIMHQAALDENDHLRSAVNSLTSHKSQPGPVLSGVVLFRHLPCFTE